MTIATFAFAGPGRRITTDVQTLLAEVAADRGYDHIMPLFVEINVCNPLGSRTVATVILAFRFNDGSETIILSAQTSEGEGREIQLEYKDYAPLIPSRRKVVRVKLYGYGTPAPPVAELQPTAKLAQVRGWQARG